MTSPGPKGRVLRRMRSTLRGEQKEAYTLHPTLFFGAVVADGLRGDVGGLGVWGRWCGSGRALVGGVEENFLGRVEERVLKLGGGDMGW